MAHFAGLIKARGERRPAVTDTRHHPPDEAAAHRRCETSLSLCGISPANHIYLIYLIYIIFDGSLSKLAPLVGGASVAQKHSTC